MQQLDILLPLTALVIWTLLVFALIPVRRLRAIAAGRVGVDEFRLGESDKVPHDVSLPNRNIINLFQMPVLFYLACIVLYITQLHDTWFINLAWAYVVFRVIHSIIHVSYNKVRHRFLAFAVSNFILVAIWIRLVWTIADQ